MSGYGDRTETKETPMSTRRLPRRHRLSQSSNTSRLAASFLAIHVLFHSNYHIASV
ncbi:hypothetical protein JMJ77_0014609, partial [Colletotrichum scovillei]